MSLRSHGVIWLLMLALAGCAGAPDLATAPDAAATGPSASGTTGSPFDPGNTLVGTPSPTTSVSASPPPMNGSALPNNFYRYVGRNYLQSWLFHPRALTAVDGHVLVADGDRVTDPLGSYGGILEFDGRSADAATPLGFPYMSLGPDANARRLSPRVMAVAATSTLVYAMDDRGVYGFMRESRNVLNLGRPYLGAGQAMAIAGSTLYVAQEGQVNAFAVGAFRSDPATPAIAIAARALAGDASGSLYVATSTQIQRFGGLQSNLAFDGKGTEGKGPGFEALVGVAADPRNGDIYALDRHAVLRFDAYGRFLSRFGAGLIQEGLSLAVGAAGEVYVADQAAKQVIQFEAGR